MSQKIQIFNDLSQLIELFGVQVFAISKKNIKKIYLNLFKLKFYLIVICNLLILLLF